MKSAHWPLSEWPFGQNWLLCIWIESIFCLLAGRRSNNQYDNELSCCWENYSFFKFTPTWKLLRLHIVRGKVVNFGPDEDLILGSLMSHPHCTLLLDDAGMRRMTSKWVEWDENLAVWATVSFHHSDGIHLIFASFLSFHAEWCL